MQSKRRAHSVIIDHLTPPMTTADGYGELAQLMQLVDEYYQLENLDPSKIPLVQKQIWDLIKKINLDEGMYFPPLGLLTFFRRKVFVHSLSHHPLCNIFVRSFVHTES